MDKPVIILLCVVFFLIIVILITLLTINSLKDTIAKTKLEASEEISQLQKNFDDEKERHKQEIAKIHQDCEKRIYQERERIENRKEILSRMNEKELLSNVMVALEGYSGRFDRIEKKLSDDKLTNNLKLILYDFSTEMNNSVNTISSQIDGIIDSIAEVKNFRLENSINNIDYNISELSSDISDISDKVYSIYNNTYDGYSYNTLAENVSSIKSDIEYTKEYSERACRAAESTRDAIES